MATLAKSCGRAYEVRSLTGGGMAADWKKVEAYLKATLETPGLRLTPRPKTPDSMEVYKGEDFLGIVYIDEEDGETSYMFEMAVLDIDLDA